jgi:hypothetical protein
MREGYACSTRFGGGILMRSGKDAVSMTWSLAVLDLLAFFVHINAERDPWAAIIAAVVVGAVLWFIVVQARRRDERRAQTRREGNDRHTRNW